MDNFVKFFLLTVVLCILIRLSYQHYDDQKQVSKSFISSKEFILFSGIIIFGCVIPVYAKMYLLEYDYDVPIQYKYLGIIFAILMLVVFLLAHHDLGRQFSPTLQLKHNHQLITTGIYHYVRHPMYLSLILLALSQMLLVPNQITTASVLISILFLVFLRIPNEENMLKMEFGEKYLEYMKNTCGVIPFLC